MRIPLILALLTLQQLFRDQESLFPSEETQGSIPWPARETTKMCKSTQGCRNHSYLPENVVEGISTWQSIVRIFCHFRRSKVPLVKTEEHRGWATPARASANILSPLGCPEKPGAEMEGREGETHQNNQLKNFISSVWLQGTSSACSCHTLPAGSSNSNILQEPQNDIYEHRCLDLKGPGLIRWQKES